MNSTYIIAEAGVNHNGNLEIAHELVTVAVDAGADAIKFQTFSATALASKDAPSAAYQKAAMGQNVSQFEMLRKLELSHANHFALKDQCESLGIDFLSSPFDMESLSFLTGELSLKTIKIPSGEITNGPMIFDAAKSDSNLIISTGMSTLSEIEMALAVVAFAETFPGETPSLEKLNHLRGREVSRNKVSLLHCTSEYPAPVDDVNLAAIPAMAKRFGLDIGYSDHTEGIVVAAAAVALGAQLIEKHFTLDRHLPGPDHRASLAPARLAEMISHIRTIERALGDGVKTPRGSEHDTLAIVRKGLVATRTIQHAEIFTPDNISALRPATGISPMEYWDRLGKQAEQDYQAGERIK